MVSAAEAVYSLAHAGLTIACIAHWARSLRVGGHYTKTGALVALILMGTHILVGVGTLSGEKLGPFLAYSALLDIRAGLLFSVGASCSSFLGLNALRARGKPDAKLYLPRTLFVGCALGLAFTLYSSVLFLIAGRSYDGVAFSAWDLWLVGVVAGPIAEESVYRVGIQQYLGLQLARLNKPYWISVVATSILFSLGHFSGGALGLLKLAQMFPISVALGVACPRYGWESCVVGHAIMNVLLWFVV